MTQKQFRLINEETAYQGFFSLKKYTVQHTLYQGGWSKPLTREVFHRGNCVAVLLYDVNRDEVIIIEQFRIGAIQLPEEQAWLLEVVAGAIEDNETPETVAYRESLEEAGCEIKQLIKICEFFTSPGGTSELLHLYCGLIDSKSVGGFHGLEHENEDIKVTAVSFADAEQLLHQGKILSAIPIIALQWLMLNRENLQQQWRD